jgi:hypothetical protein
MATTIPLAGHCRAKPVQPHSVRHLFTRLLTPVVTSTC